MHLPQSARGPRRWRIGAVERLLVERQNQEPTMLTWVDLLDLVVRRRSSPKRDAQCVMKPPRRGDSARPPGEAPPSASRRVSESARTRTGYRPNRSAIACTCLFGDRDNA